MTKMDRWSIQVTEASAEDRRASDSDEIPDVEGVQAKIPFTIINNYFSIGVVSVSS